MPNTTTDLTTLLSSYITQRDAMRTRKANGGDFTTNEFLDLINGHGERLRRLLPALNLAEMEALCELSGNMLNEYRRKLDAGRLKL